jgi:zinc transport system substrate-binding protein
MQHNIHSHYSLKQMIRLIITGFLLFILSANTHAADIDNKLTQQAVNTRPIVVTIKPLFSLVAHLIEGIDTPVLLMKQMQSPHHYNMKPSERKLLANARMIIWIGPQMESHLSKIIQQQKNSTVVISVMQANDLTLHDKRTDHSHHDNDNDEFHTASSSLQRHSIDPHIWLSTNNAVAISKQICEKLMAHDPDNKEQYQNNLQTLLSKIEQTRDFIKTTLKHSNQPFITFHDAFQYFEKDNGLNYIDSINFDDETGTSLKHLRQIRALINKHKIQCLIYQSPKPAIINSLTRKTTVKAVALDPLGLEVENDKNAWFELMQKLAVDFNYCLSS